MIQKIIIEIMILIERWKVKIQILIKICTISIHTEIWDIMILTQIIIPKI
jgi:hypothetical protein